MNAVHGRPHVVPDGFLVRGRMPEFGQILGEEPIGDRLAVDENTVIVEDHEVVSHGSTLNDPETQKTPAGHPAGVFSRIVRRRPTLPQGPPCSTIGAVRLSFRVRNVTGRFPHAMTTETL